MKKYIGTKQIEAEPMTMGEAYRRGLLHAGRVPSESEKSKDGYYVRYDNGYESWSPADVFEKVYRVTDTSLVRNAGDGGKWYKVKNNLVSLDEKTGKEKKMPVYLLVEAKDIDDARATLENFMKGTISDWQCESIQETKILDVFTFDVTSAQ